MQIPTPIKSSIQQRLAQHVSFVDFIQFTSVGGGSINETYRISLNNRSAFCKLNSVSKFPQLFQKEKAGLELIARQGIVKTPTVIDCFEQEDTQILLLEWVQSGERTEVFWKEFGERLATLHHVFADFFGLHEDNYMGSVPQSNRQQKNWAVFFVAERLQPMIDRCFRKGQLSLKHRQQFEKLQSRLATIFEEEKPSLLHGDLWSGNFMCNGAGEPVLIDPAAYYGHRSVDLAMTTLFGGFRSSFYEAYNHHFPLPKNYEEQCAICNLYPLLVHLYLFGRSYLPQIENTLQHFA